MEGAFGCCLVLDADQSSPERSSILEVGNLGIDVNLLSEDHGVRFIRSSEGDAGCNGMCRVRSSEREQGAPGQLVLAVCRDTRRGALPADISRCPH